MPGRQRLLAEAEWLTSVQLLELGREIRVARIAAGYRLVDVARLARMSTSQISRIERGKHRSVTYAQLATLAAVVGLRMYSSAKPARRRLLDRPQLELFGRLQKRAAAHWAWTTEEPMPIKGDLRAADAVARLPGCSIAFELINRLSNYQLQARAALLKGRDLGGFRVVLVIRGTSSNRQALREAGPALPSSFPLGSRAVLHALIEARDPGANGVIVL